MLKVFYGPFHPDLEDAFASRLAELAALKQPVVVVNKGGAGTVLGTLEVIKANPDGYTLGLLSNGLVASHYVLPDTPAACRVSPGVGRRYGYGSDYPGFAALPAASDPVRTPNDRRSCRPRPGDDA